ncbi:MAG TPA: sigma-70 family RNA polymerase sigma factor [Anaerolineae bacterium]|nr:sigma-70 family RNA polymerase sigma factor [Anaerolineae bacterium]
MLQNERQLVERAARRDASAFAILYELYYDKIYKYLYFKTMQPNEAEDLTALVFLKAWEAIGSFHWQGYPFSAWLYRIAHNQLIDHYRARHELLPIEVAEDHESSDDPFQAVEQASLLAQIRGALKNLTQEQQRVVTLHYFEGYSICEIALMMGKGPDAIRAMLHRALRGLQPRVAMMMPSARKSRAPVATRSLD